MKKLMLLAFLYAAGCATTKSFQFSKFNPKNHCNRIAECYTMQYGAVQPAELKLCYETFVERYGTATPKQQAILDAFYTDCDEFPTCGYSVCMSGHVEATLKGKIFKQLLEKYQNSSNVPGSGADNESAPKAE